VVLKHLAQASSPERDLVSVVWFYLGTSLKWRVLILGDRTSRSSERSSPKWVIVDCLVVLLNSPPRWEFLVLGEGQSRPGEKSSPKQDFAVSHYSTLAQARKLSLSETGLVTQAKVSSPSEYSVVCVCCLYALMRTWIRRCCAMSG